MIIKKDKILKNVTSEELLIYGALKKWLWILLI